MKIGHEDSELIAIMDWVRLKRFEDFIFHIAGERKCSKAYGAILKRKGHKAGVSDIFIARASKGLNGAWIELKIKPNKLTLKQAEFLTNMWQEGYGTYVAYSAEEAINI